MKGSQPPTRRAFDRARAGFCLLGLIGILAGVAHAQRTPLSELWREWEVLHAEWRAERAVFEEDRAFNARLRDRRRDR